MKRCTKAVIPVAGYGTRRLPITKSIEKCMLPLGNRPVIDYIVSDCVEAGITDIYFVVSGDAAQLRSYYGRDMKLEEYLTASGKASLVPAVQPPRGVRFHYVQQEDEAGGRYGTTVPVWCCREYIDEDELFLLVMGDDVTYNASEPSDIRTLVHLEAPAILGVPIAEGDLSQYGVIARDESGMFTHIQEKPAPGTELSRMANVSKYVLPGTFMKFASASIDAGPNEKGEYYITDPINDCVADGLRMRVVEARGQYLDTGTLEAWVRANDWLLKNV